MPNLLRDSVEEERAIFDPPSSPLHPDAQNIFDSRRKFLLQLSSLGLAFLLSGDEIYGQKKQSKNNDTSNEKASWLRKFQQLPVCNIETPGSRRQIRPGVCVEGEAFSGSGVLVKKNGKVYLLSARHIIRHFNKKHIELPNLRDTAVIQIEKEDPNYEDFYKTATEYSKWSQQNRVTIEEMNGQSITIKGCHIDDQHIITGPCLYSRNELVDISPPMRGKGGKDIMPQYSLDRFVIKVPSDLDPPGLSGSPVFFRKDKIDRLAGLVVAGFPTKNYNIVLLSTPNDVYNVLDQI